jgi:1-acyl-sn-glycerol-3-phosphate acyltransferase
MFLVRARPDFVGKKELSEFFKKNQAAMFVANHNSWLDIPFIGGTIGWRNYKLVSKAELERVPILGKAIKLGGHLMLDRSDRKSQLLTLRQGMDWLKVRTEK